MWILCGSYVDLIWILFVLTGIIVINGNKDEIIIIYFNNFDISNNLEALL